MARLRVLPAFFAVADRSLLVRREAAAWACFDSASGEAATVLSRLSAAIVAPDRRLAGWCGLLAAAESCLAFLTVCLEVFAGIGLR